jgi:3-deoxy-D-manno-octulosonic-acid transferase
MSTISPVESGFIFLLYFVARALLAPLLAAYWLYRGGRDPRYLPTLAERLGGAPAFYQATRPGGVWLHAVSVGEVIAATRLIDELRTRDPSVPLYLSTTTLAGRAVAEEKFLNVIDGIFYAPVDYAFAVRRVLERLRPAALVILETEIWPVLYREAALAGVAVLIVNGRISDRALPRYRWLTPLFRAALALPQAIYAQSEIDRRRYVELGAPDQRVMVAGNLKYDAAPLQGAAPAFVVDMITALRPCAVWIAASTMAAADASDIDEDDAVIAAFGELAATRKDLLLILVPRKPERFDIVARKLDQAGVRFIRRSHNFLPESFRLPGALLLDSIGELAGVFACADVVFMGGTLARRGGHNVLEPAACGKALVVGPHMENFAAIAADFRERKAWIEIVDNSELAKTVALLLDDPRLREDLGRRAIEAARARSGAAAKLADVILNARDRAIPMWGARSPSWPLLWPLSRIWLLGNMLKQRRDAARARTLPAPVISVGGVGMGGAGKTPMVEWLAERLANDGHRPVILTRGYRRRSIARVIVIPAGGHAATYLTGDEAQIFLRAGHAHLAIGADRYQAARLAGERLNGDVFVLDDGFQHRRLRRNLDIVLIDALNPFSGGEVFPLGGLREPLQALTRADAFVISRAEPQRNYTGITEELRRHNRLAPIFRSTVRPLGWVNAFTGFEIDQPASGSAAFCGLANPAAFWRSLHEQNIEPAFRWTFADHHRYNARELRRLTDQACSHGAHILLTTEKDAANLPDDAARLIAPLDLYWLKIELVIQEEEELLALIASKLR